MVNRTNRNIYECVKARLGAQLEDNKQPEKRQALEHLHREVLLDEYSMPFAQRIQHRFAGLPTDELPIPARRGSCSPKPL